MLGSVAQAGLKHPGSSSPPASVYQIAGIISVYALLDLLKAPRRPHMIQGFRKPISSLLTLQGTLEGHVIIESCVSGPLFRALAVAAAAIMRTPRYFERDQSVTQNVPSLSLSPLDKMWHREQVTENRIRRAQYVSPSCLVPL